MFGLMDLSQICRKELSLGYSSGTTQKIHAFQDSKNVFLYFPQIKSKFFIIEFFCQSLYVFLEIRQLWNSFFNLISLKEQTF